MAPRRGSPDPASSDEEAPEAFSFGSSKKVAKGEHSALQQFQAAEKQKRKDRNRERDRARKERAEQARLNGVEMGKGKAKEKVVKGKTVGGASRENVGGGRGGPPDDLEARMERAMREADEESRSEGEISGMGGIEDVGEDVSEASNSEVMEEENGEHDEDEDMLSQRDEDEDDSDTSSGGSDDWSSQRVVSSNPNYLPDSVFKAAFAEASLASYSKRTLDASDNASQSPLKKRIKRPSEDVVIGSRIIRTLTKSSVATHASARRALLPPARVNMFLRRSLNLKGTALNAKAKGWERRPANVGIMKRDGPAASFVRNR